MIRKVKVIINNIILFRSIRNNLYSNNEKYPLKQFRISYLALYNVDFRDELNPGILLFISINAKKKNVIVIILDQNQLDSEVK